MYKKNDEKGLRKINEGSTDIHKVQKFIISFRDKSFDITGWDEF